MLKKKIHETHYITNSTLSNTSLNSVFKSKEEKNKKLKRALLDRTQIHSSQNSNNIDKYKNLSVIVKQRSTNIINYKKEANNINKIQSFNTLNSNKIGRNRLIRLSNSTERLEPLKCICCTCCCCCCPFFTPIKFYRSKSKTRRRKNSFNHQRNSTLINIKKYLTNSAIKNVISRKNRKIDVNMNLSGLLKKFKMQQTQKIPPNKKLEIKNKKIEEKINKIKEESNKSKEENNKVKEENNKINVLKNINKVENDRLKNKKNELKNKNKEENKKYNDETKNKINELKNKNKEENKKDTDETKNKSNELKNKNKQENNKKNNNGIKNKNNELKNKNKEENLNKKEQKINKNEQKNIIKFEKLKKLKKKVKYDLTKINSEQSKLERINNILYGIPYMNEKKECELCHKLVASHTYKFHFYSHPSKILNWLFLGTFKNANNFDEINTFGIKHILNCAVEIIPKNIPNNIKYCHINMLDDQNIDITLYFKKAFGFIEQARKKGEKILIHCKLGISRSPALLIGYFIKYRGFTTDSALEFIRSKRSQVHPNIGFIEQLYSYEKSLKQNQKSENNGSISNSTTMEYSISK